MFYKMYFGYVKEGHEKSQPLEVGLDGAYWISRIGYPGRARYSPGDSRAGTCQARYRKKIELE